MSAPPPTPAIPDKKGLPTAAKVAIGCLFFLVVVGGIAGYLMWKAAMWVKEEVGDFMENPQASIAEMVIKNHPELELIDSDRENGVFTLKYAEDGETYTAKLADLKEGKFVLTDEDGNETILGNVDPSKIPDWVPQPAGISETQVIYVNTNNGKSTGQYLAKHKGDPEATIEAIKKAFPNDTKNSSSKMQNGKNGQWSVQLTSDNKTLNVMLYSEDNQGQLTINWAEK